MHAIDFAIQNYFSLIRSPGLTEFMYVVSAFFDRSIYFFILMILFATLVYLFRGLYYSIFFSSSLFFGAVAVLILKWIFGIARPTDFVVSAFGASFPSYHATIATIFFVMIMCIFDGYFKSLPRAVFNALCITCILLIAFSRVYLGAHWASDVLAGVFLGLLISFLFEVLFRRFVHSNLQAVISRVGDTSMIK